MDEATKEVCVKFGLVETPQAERSIRSWPLQEAGGWGGEVRLR